MRCNERITALCLAAGLAVSGSAGAATYHWTDWLSNGVPDTVSGQIDVGGETVGVTFTGVYSTVQYGGDATNYWATNPTTYTSPEVDNGPSTSDMIQLTTGGIVEITFDRPVVDPVFALVSWNRNTAEFYDPIEILSSGPGYWGSGTFQVDPSGTGFFGNGEVHGLVGLTGNYGTVRMSHTSESWHGFTIGIRAIAQQDPNGVPTPMPLALLGAGALALAFSRRSRPS